MSRPYNPCRRIFNYHVDDSSLYYGTLALRKEKMKSKYIFTAGVIGTQVAVIWVIVDWVTIGNKYLNEMTDWEIARMWAWFGVLMISVALLIYGTREERR
jgi:hypothetical protein